MTEIELANLHPTEEFALDWLAQAIADAFPGCLAVSRENATLRALNELEISLVGDETITEVHGRFMDDPTATDVITFDHGEILISLDTARRQAAERGEPYRREVLLYAIHGLLHLGGYEDLDPVDRAEMEARQFEILGKVCPAEGGEADDVLETRDFPNRGKRL